MKFLLLALAAIVGTAAVFAVLSRDEIARYRAIGEM